MKRRRCPLLVPHKFVHGDSDFSKVYSALEVNEKNIPLKDHTILTEPYIIFYQNLWLWSFFPFVGPTEPFMARENANC